MEYIVTKVPTGSYVICVWSDYEWCYIDDIFMYSHKSDDLIVAILTFEDEPSEDQLKKIIDKIK